MANGMNPFGPYEEKFAGDRTSQADMMQGMEQASQISRGEDIRFGPDSPLAYKAPDSMLDLLKSASGFVSTGVDYLGTLDKNNIEQHEAEMQKFLNDVNTGKIDAYNKYDDEGNFISSNWEAATKEVRRRNKEFNDSTWLFTTSGNLKGEMLRFKSEATAVGAWGGNVKLLWADRFEDLVSKGYGAEEIADEFDIWVESIQDVELRNSLREWKSRKTTEMSSAVEAENFAMFELEVGQMSDAMIAEALSSGHLDGNALSSFKNPDNTLTPDARFALATQMIDVVGSDSMDNRYNSEFLRERFESPEKNKYKTAIIKAVNRVEQKIIGFSREHEAITEANQLETNVLSVRTHPMTSSLHAQTLQDIRSLSDKNPKLAQHMLDKYMDGLIQTYGKTNLEAYLDRGVRVPGLGRLIPEDWTLLRKIVDPVVHDSFAIDHTALDELYNGNVSRELDTTLRWMGLSEEGTEKVDSIDNYVRARLNNYKETGRSSGGNPSEPYMGPNGGIASWGNGRTTPTSKEQNDAFGHMGLQELMRMSSYDPTWLDNDRASVNHYMLNAMMMMKAPDGTNIFSDSEIQWLNQIQSDPARWNIPETRQQVSQLMQTRLIPSEDGISPQESSYNLRQFRRHYTSALQGTPVNTYPDGVPKHIADGMRTSVDNYLYRMTEADDDLSEAEQQHFIEIVEWYLDLPDGAGKARFRNGFGDDNPRSDQFMEMVSIVKDTRIRTPEQLGSTKTYDAMKATATMTQRGATRGEILSTYSLMAKRFVNQIRSGGRMSRTEQERLDEMLGRIRGSIFPGTVEEFRDTLVLPVGEALISHIEQYPGYQAWVDANNIGNRPNDVYAQFRTQLEATPFLAKFDELVLGQIIYEAGTGRPIDETVVNTAIENVVKQYVSPGLRFDQNGKMTWRQGSLDTMDRNTGESYNLHDTTKLYTDQLDRLGTPNVINGMNVLYKNMAVNRVAPENIERLINTRVQAFPPSVRDRVSATLLRQLPAIQRGFREDGGLAMQLGDLDTLIELTYDTWEADSNRGDEDYFLMRLDHWNREGSVDLVSNAREYSIDPNSMQIQNPDTGEFVTRGPMLQFSARIGASVSERGDRWTDGTPSQYIGVAQNRRHHGVMVVDDLGNYVNAHEFVELNDEDLAGSWSRENGLIPVKQYRLTEARDASPSGLSPNLSDERREALYGIPMFMFHDEGMQESIHPVLDAYPMFQDPFIRRFVQDAAGFEGDDAGWYKFLSEEQRKGTLFQEHVPKGSPGAEMWLALTRTFEADSRSVRHSRPSTRLQGAINKAILAKKKALEFDLEPGSITVQDVNDVEAVGLTMDGLAPGWSWNGIYQWTWGESVTPRSEWGKWKEAYHKLFFEAPGEVAGAIYSIPEKLQEGFADFDKRISDKGLQKRKDSGEILETIDDIVEDSMVYELPERQRLRRGQGMPRVNLRETNRYSRYGEKKTLLDAPGMMLEAVGSIPERLQEGFSRREAGIPDNRMFMQDYIGDSPWWAITDSSLRSRMDGLLELTIMENIYGFNNSRTLATINPHVVDHLTNLSPEEFWNHVSLPGISPERELQIQQLKNEYTKVWNNLSAEEQYGMYHLGIDSKEELFQLHMVYGHPSMTFMPADPREVSRSDRLSQEHPNMSGIREEIRGAFTLDGQAYLDSLVPTGDFRSLIGSDKPILTSRHPQYADFDHIMDTVIATGSRSWAQFFSDTASWRGDKNMVDRLFDREAMFRAWNSVNKEFNKNFFYWTAKGYNSPDELFNREFRKLIVKGSGLPGDLDLGFWGASFEEPISRELDRGMENWTDIVGLEREKEKKKAKEETSTEPKEVSSVSGTGGILGMLGAAAMGTVDVKKDSLKETPYQTPEGQKIYENKWGDLSSDDGRMWTIPIDGKAAAYITELEGFHKKPERATRGEKFLTIGKGHLLDGSSRSRQRFAEALPHKNYDEFMQGKGSLTKEEADALFALDLPDYIQTAKDLTPTWDTLSPNLQIQIVAATYRGSWGYSRNTRDFVKEGKFKEAAVEFLNSDEYRNAVELGRPGIRPRMEAVAKALELEAERRK